MSTQDFRPPHEERRPMHSGDAERLELLELMADIAERDLEKAVECADKIALVLEECRERARTTKQNRDSFRAAMEGMGCKL